MRTKLTRAEWAAKDLLGMNAALIAGHAPISSFKELSRVNKAIRDAVFGPSSEQSLSFATEMFTAYENLLDQKAAEQAERDAEEKRQEVEKAEAYKAAQAAQEEKLARQHEAELEAKAAAEAVAHTFTITVGGQQGAGKTTLLIALLTGLANADMLSDRDTAELVTQPIDLLQRLRVMNATSEAVEIKVKARDIADYQAALGAAR